MPYGPVAHTSTHVRHIINHTKQGLPVLLQQFCDSNAKAQCHSSYTNLMSWPQIIALCPGLACKKAFKQNRWLTM